MWDKFDKRTLDYDSWYDRHPDIYLKELDLLTIDSPGPKLEVAVGTGRMGSRLGYDVGLDPSLNSLHMAQSRGIDCVLGVAETLPFAESSLGTVLICMSLWLFEDRRKALEEARRILHQDGKLIIAITYAESPLGIEYAGKRDADPGSFYGDCWLLTREELRTIIEETGFTVVSEKEAGLDTPDVWAVVCRKKPTS